MLAILVFASINAQGVELGVKAGLNVPTITGDNTDNLSSFFTYHAGAFANIEVSERFSVQPECMFSCQGAEYEDSDSYDGKFVLGYLNVPIMAHYAVTDCFNLEIGPQFGLLLSAEDQYENDFESGEEDAKDFFKDFDFGVNFGASYELSNGIGFAARYNLGLANILDEDGVDDQIRNSVFQFSISYVIFGGANNNDDED